VVSREMRMTLGRSAEAQRGAGSGETGADPEHAEQGRDAGGSDQGARGLSAILCVSRLS
jgi:hypothetical protein